jgi:SAM-dependent methyltransferase
MTHADIDTVRRHWERSDLGDAIVAAIQASGRDPATLTVDDLAPLDQFHGGGLAATRRLAKLGELSPAMHVLDVGGGLGGPARTLAIEFGCRVTVIELAESYVDAGRRLTSMLALDDRVTFHVGDALTLPFHDGAFDAVWTQNSGMNIADKAGLYAGFHRVIRPGGRLVTQEPMAGLVRPPIYPLMWAPDPATDHLLPPDAMRAVIERSGFQAVAWEEVSPGGPPPGPAPAQTVQRLVMGEARVAQIAAAARRNEQERRIVMIHAVFAR